MNTKTYNEFLKNGGEQQWQRYWGEKKTFMTENQGSKPKYYVLDMFPYPSGEGLHVGHLKGYIATDIVSRFKRMQGFNVLHPMGWDAFGLPAENYALKHKIHPAKAIEENIKTYKKQISIVGLDYDWSREVNTTDPKYYKWTQWIFLQMFKKGLAYESNEPINWCPSCKTGLANEDLEDGKCERCGSDVELKLIRQWVLKITDYADRLLEGLKNLDWEDYIKEMQINWIGKSEGTNIKLQIVFPRQSALAPLDTKLSNGVHQRASAFVKVFTTRVDTIFGVTAIILAPEHELIKKLESRIQNLEEVKEYLEKAKKKSDLERTDLSKTKTGVELKGIKVLNPINHQELPLWVGDYVIATYGGGAVIMVAAHDERDFTFAQKYNLSIVEVVKSIGKDVERGSRQELLEAFCSDGVLINSGDFNGLTSAQAREKITDWLIKNNAGNKQINYKLRDWIFSRQRYWGEPIPVVHCEKCGVVAISEDQLPVLLPTVESYEPTGTGESPLANIKEWVNTKCPKCGGRAQRETNTMPNWAGSCWYYLRYIDPLNDKFLVDKNQEKYWSPVDLYVGGAEHATRHLIYARFWHKFLFDIGIVNFNEPFKKFQHVGLILGADERKMSKRWGNVINPDEIVEKHGADTLRLYEMFMGPFDEAISWSTTSLVGCARFVNRIWEMSQSIAKENNHKNFDLEKLLHKTIKKVSEDIESLKFNTAVSALMILVNAMEEQKQNLPRDIFVKFLIILSPFAPHLTEELWHNLTGASDNQSIGAQPWPQFDSELIQDKEIELIVQINGKLRDKIMIQRDLKEDEVKALVLQSEKIKKYLNNQPVKKIIFVPGRLINLVV